MAEFCLDCWNRINETEDSKKKYILSRRLDLCEGCGEWKHVIVVERRIYYKNKLKYLVLPLMIISVVILFALKYLM